MDITFNAYLFNPVFWHIRRALKNPKIRKILVRGGSSAGKTAGVCDALNIFQLEELRNVFALRKQRVHVETTIKKSFEASIDRLEGLDGYFRKMDGEIRVGTGALTTYAGIDDPEKVKGLESYDFVYCNELNQFESAEWDELNRRLRGRPGQKLIADWNPISSIHWINQEILSADTWIDLPLFLPEEEEQFGAFTRLTEDYSFVRLNTAGDTIWINITYRDNFWIVGHPGNTEPDPEKPGMYVAPDGRLYGFVDVHTLANFERMKQKKPNDYRIYGLGQDGLIRTGGEFWPQFEEAVHVSKTPIEYDPNYPLHATVDSNVSPYITISIWQVVKTQIRQIKEIPCRSPDNTALKAALALDKYLQRIDHRLALNVYGDPAANARSTTDDEGRSFFDKFIGTLNKCSEAPESYRVINRVGRSAPGVSLSGDFVNDIYEGICKPWSIIIDLRCTVSIEDYTLVKKAPDGTMLKEKVPDPADPDKKRKIEKYGHFSDAKRYFITTLLSDLFANYKNRQRTPRVMSVTQP